MLIRGGGGWTISPLIANEMSHKKFVQLGKGPTDPGGTLLNQTRGSPSRVMMKASHMMRSRTACRCRWDLYPSK